MYVHEAGNEELPWRAPRNGIDRALALGLNWRSKSLWVAGGEVSTLSLLEKLPMPALIFKRFWGV